MNASVIETPACEVAGMPASRVSHLFRQSLRQGQTHPLLHLMRRYRADDSPLHADPERVMAPAPRAPIDGGALRAHLVELPAMPQAVMQALAAVQNESASIEDCAKHIEHDQALAARTLKLANSAFFGVAGRVATVSDAVNILGLRTLTMLLTTAAVASRFGSVQCPGFELPVFWRHAVGCGLAARAIGRLRSVDPALAFVAGLLHEVGQLALAVHCPAELSVALAWSRSADLPMLDAERAVLGLDHVEVGTAIARHWKFPQAVVDGIAGHHQPAAEGAIGVADVVHAADALVHALDLTHEADEYVPALELHSWVRLGLTQPQGQAVLDEVGTGVDDICRLLGF